MDLGLLLILLFPVCCTLASLSTTTAGLLIADAKTVCMHPVNMQTQNFLHLGQSRCCLVEVSGYNDCWCLEGLLFIPWAQTCSRVVRRLRLIRRKPWQNVKNVSDLDQNVRNVRDPIKTWRARKERTSIAGRNVVCLLSLRDSANLVPFPLSHPIPYIHTPTARHEYRDRPWENSKT